MNMSPKIEKLYTRIRILKYKLLSDCSRITGSPKIYHPVLTRGAGKIAFQSDVQIGVITSPKFYSHYCYLEARTNDSIISIGNNVSINNDFSASILSQLIIEDDVLIGVSCSIIDTDAHHLEPHMRLLKNPPAQKVHIMENVFIGSNVTILKGVTIGKNSVIGNGSIVTKNIPENVIAAGNPAKVIKILEADVS